MITFVTAFYSLEKQNKTTDFYFQMFEELASSSVNIMLYLDDRYTQKGNELIEKYNNLRIEYKNFQILKKEIIDVDFNNYNFILPSIRNINKDNLEYFYVQLSKLYHLSLYANNKENKDTHIAWIDFGIFYLFKEKEMAKMFLKILSKLDLPKNVVLAPGSWSCNLFDNYKECLFDMISWFFCGSFMIGDINLFNILYQEQQKLVYDNLPHITWEVNYWSIINRNMPDIFMSIPNCDHNDLLLINTFNHLNI